MKFKKGQHVICKYQGTGGDLLVGRVESVRTNGDVLLTNLVSDTRSVKKASVLATRNMIVTKVQALEVLGNGKDRAAIRARAVHAAASGGEPNQLKLRLEPELAASREELKKSVDATVDAVVSSFRALNPEMRLRALDGIWATVRMNL